MKLKVYEHLLRMNVGFDQAIRSLVALGKHSAFHRVTLARFTALSKEARAATNSYLASVIEKVLTSCRPVCCPPNCPSQSQLLQTHGANQRRIFPQVIGYRRLGSP